MIVNNKKYLIISACFLFLAVLLLSSYFYFNHRIDSPASPDSTEKTFLIPKGKGANWIAENLEKEGLILDDFYFKIYVFLKKSRKRLQAGEYLLRPNMTIREIADFLVQGKATSREVELTIPEGFKTADIEKRLIEKGLVREGQFMELVVNVNQELVNHYDFLKDKPVRSSLEGYCFPDTYKIFKDVPIQNILEKMLDNFDRQLSDNLREEIRKQNKTIYEVITLASIVQNEVGSIEDMRKVAGIFLNRLKIGQALQSDATINFITEKNLRQPTLEDTRVNSSYNTYLYPGLPPGPISNPGLEAIKAVIFPEKTDYFYFLNPLDGSTIFSKTLEEHNTNRAEYLP